MRELVLSFLHRQRSAGFRDLAGAEAAGTIPLSDRLIDQLIASTLPADGPVSAVHVHALEGNRAAVRVTLRRFAFLPAISFTLAIEEQPRLPDRPILGIRLSGSALLSLSGQVAKFLGKLPPWITMHGDYLEVDLAVMLQAYDVNEWLKYLTELRVTTREGAVAVSFGARVLPPHSS